MKETSGKNIALVGNPNTGKTSLFNKLTGLVQKVGNYPGVTVEKKQGSLKVDGQSINVIDLPGTYNLIPESNDELVVLDLIKKELDYPTIDQFIFIAEVSNLRRNLLLFTQLKDLGLPIILAVNMVDQLTAKKLIIDRELLSKELGTDVVFISVRSGEGIDELKRKFTESSNLSASSKNDEWISRIKNYSKVSGGVNKVDELSFRTDSIHRLRYINQCIDKCVSKKGAAEQDKLRKKLDGVFLHRFAGMGIFFGIVLLIFQAVYSWSSFPMEWIDESFASLSQWLKNRLSPGLLTNLLAEGIVPGIGGVVIFIPQIVVLFFFIGLLEESGYMSRVVFITDKVMRKFGLSGKSIIPLISGTACAIPAVLATRNIQNNKEKLITILVTPFITCSARLPVYLMMIALVIPATKFFGINLQAIVLFGLYILGFVTALLAAWILSKTLKLEGKEGFVIEMPDYRLPSMKNVFLEVLNKTKSFVFDAGKVIVALSILLWFLASHGWGDNYNNAEEIVKSQYQDEYSEEELAAKIQSYQLEHSFIGTAGRAIEPVIKPLGYDWKIGIAVISSFAAREVFIGSLATIYNVGNEEFDSIENKMSKEVRSDGEKVYNLATGISILLFYVFAMQCMSTLAIVKAETGGWKWPMIQLFGMTLLAYVSALIAYQGLN